MKRNTTAVIYFISAILYFASSIINTRGNGGSMSYVWMALGVLMFCLGVLSLKKSKGEENEAKSLPENDEGEREE